MKHVTSLTFYKNLLLPILILSCCIVQAQESKTANSFTTYRAYKDVYNYGMNQGYYGPGWSSKNTAILSRNLGVRTLRVPLYDEFLTTYGLQNLVPDFTFFRDSLGMGEMLAFIGKPHSSHRDTTRFGATNEPSLTFAGLYEPIWLDENRTRVNPKNTFAKYLVDIVTTYGEYVRFWEVVNEPDFTYSQGGWLGDFDPSSTSTWFRYDPKPDELVNLRAPITYYNRMMRVTWEVVKKLQPNDYVCTGGIGYKSFLDAMLRNTDNPVDGSVTKSYPFKGGAYFDVLSFHNYPMYYLKAWDHSKGQVVSFRHSDAAVTALIKIKDNMDSLLQLYGYNGIKYPKKQVICTETGVSRIMGGYDWGSNEGQLNFMIKAQVAAQRSGIKQLYWYQLGDMPNTKEQFDQMGLYYHFGNNKPYDVKKTDQGKALHTITQLLYNSVYDSSHTAALQLPTNVDGGAFKAKDGKYVYVLWAKTTTDLSEDTKATYTFPTKVIAGSSLVKRDWNFAENKKSTTVSKTNVVLTGTPAFFLPR